MICGNSFFSRSSARTSAATVLVGCTSFAMSGSSFIAFSGFRIAREVLVVELQHVRVRRQVADALEDGEREVGRVHLERKALADQTGDLVLILQRVDARDHAARAVAEQVDRHAGFALLRDLDEHRDVADIVRHIVDIEALAVRFTAAAQVERVDREARGLQLLAGPQILTAVGIDAMDRWPPRRAASRSDATTGRKSKDPLRRRTVPHSLSYPTSVVESSCLDEVTAFVR